MKFKIALLSACSYFAMTSTASAAFTIGAFIINGIYASTGAILALSPVFIGNAVLLAGAVGASILQSKLGRSRGSNPGDFKSEFNAPAVGAINAVGRVRLAGLKAFGNTSGFNRDRIVWHCKGEVVKVREYFLGKRSVVVEMDGAVSSPPWGKQGGTSYAYLKTQMGTGNEVAWPELVAAYPNLITANHRGRGNAQTHKRLISPGVTTQKFGQLFQSNGDPDVEILADVSKVYDPRNGLTQWTRNGVLIAAHVMMQDPSIKFENFDWDLIGIEATKADAMGITASGVWSDEDNRADVVKDVLQSIGSASSHVAFTDDQKIYIRLIDDAPISEITFFEDDILSIEGPGRQAAVSRPNICRLSYYSPEQNYELADLNISTLPWANDYDDQALYGDKTYDVVLPFCYDYIQAQKIARRMFAYERARVGTLTTNWAGACAYGLKYATIPLPDIGNILVEMGSPRIMGQEGKVQIPFREVPILSIWNPATDQVAAPDPVPEFGGSTALARPPAPSFAQTVQTGLSTYGTRVEFSIPATGGANSAEVRYRQIEANGDRTQWASMVELNSQDGSLRYATFAGDQRGLNLEFSVQTFNSATDDVSEQSIISSALPLGLRNGLPSLTVVSGGFVNQNLDIDVYFASNSISVSKIIVERLQAGSSVWNLYQTAYVSPQTTTRVQGTVAQKIGINQDYARTYYFRIYVINSIGTIGQTIVY